MAAFTLVIISLVAVVSELVKSDLAIFQDPADPVLVELALVDQLAAGVNRKELAGLIGVVFFFDDVC